MQPESLLPLPFSAAVSLSSLARLATSKVDLETMQAALGSEDDPPLFFSWNDAAVSAFRAAAATLVLAMVPVGAPFGPIPPTTLGLKHAILVHVAQASAPGVAVLMPNALGLTCASGAASLRAIGAVSHLSCSAWAAALLNAAPVSLGTLATIFTSCEGAAAAARGDVERVFPGAVHPALFD